MPQFYTRLCICALAGLVAWPAAAQAPRRGGTAGVTVALPTGWHSIRPDQGNVTNPFECFAGRGGSIQFAARGHTFAAYVMLGPNAPSRLAHAARAVLDTLRIAPR